ncbi:hypothetical protein BC830DRAFT_1136148 [Chytriomyces sp. MP71]|nr:hypothetical protein BC830DRAFT_1136148 [Chytriomyces sp. MP71]
MQPRPDEMNAAPANATGVQGTKAMKPCRFFGTLDGCRSGADCVFSHDLGRDKDRRTGKGRSDSASTVAAASREVPTSPDAALNQRRQRMQRGQKSGAKKATAEATAPTPPQPAPLASQATSQQRASLPSKPPPASRAPVARPAANRIAENLTPLQLELRSIERRFRSSYKVISATPVLFADPPSLNPSNATITATAAQLVSQFPPTILELELAPSDPDFPFDLEQLSLRLVIPTRLLPAATTHISTLLTDSRIKVLNPEIPPALARAVETGWRRQLGVALMTPTACVPGQTLLTLFNWLDRHLERLLSGIGSESRDVVGVTGIVVNQNRHSEEELRRGIVERVDAGLRGVNLMVPRSSGVSADGGYKDRIFYYGVPNSDNNAESSSDTDETGSEFNELDDTASTVSKQLDEEGPADQEEDAEPTLDPSSSTISATPQHRGTQIKLLNPTMKGISLLECVHPKFLLSCLRCKSNFDSPPHMGANTPCARTCPTCTAVLGITFRPGMVHMSSQTVGYLDLEGYGVADFLPSAWRVTCEGCNQATEGIGILKSLPRGETEMRVGCKHCHAKMGIMINDIKFVKLQPSLMTTSSPLPLKSKKKRTLADEGIVLGQPLPHNGACTHYRKSYRWFRFPCCARAYPCDQCHEAQKPDAHEMQWANRMICGFCAREQVYSQQASCLCGRELTRRSGGGGGFWEGGQGTRTRHLMSRKDPRKTKGLGKTQSQKANRVGKKAE